MVDTLGHADRRKAFLRIPAQGDSIVFGVDHDDRGRLDVLHHLAARDPGARLTALMLELGIALALLHLLFHFLA